jgi:choline dehydrogenase-like flavoprotein
MLFQIESHFNTLLPNVKVMPDYLVVGAGFSGVVLAERIARHLGKTVLLSDLIF